MNSAVLLLSFVCSVSAQYGPARTQYGPATPDYDEPALYKFEYSVTDDYSNSHFSQEMRTISVTYAYIWTKNLFLLVAKQNSDKKIFEALFLACPFNNLYTIQPHTYWQLNFTGKFKKKLLGELRQSEMYNFPKKGFVYNLNFYWNTRLIYYADFLNQ